MRISDWSSDVCSSDLRVLRPDLPGFGQSPTPADYNWSADELARDLIAFVCALGVERVHIVAAKYGGTVAMVLASKLGERVISLSLRGAPHKGDGVGSAPNLIRELGVTGWAARSQRSRLGADTSEEQVEWWTYGLMGKSDPRPCIGASSSRAFMTELNAELRAITDRKSTRLNSSH